MKKITQLTILFLFFVLSVNAQTVPLGMKYQAVARDHAGGILANQKISLKVTLYSEDDRRTQYSEIHSSITNKLGLFSLTIGEGETEAGTFEEVPWSTANIWMELAIDEAGGNDFITISESALLAVPYAFHAVTANQLTGNGVAGARGPGGVPWEVGGNVFAPIGVPGSEERRLGTLSFHDLILITNDTPAMSIAAADGKVDVVGDARIGNDLEVNNNALIGVDVQIGNDLRIGNNTLVGNNLDVVENTQLGGTLKVKSTTELNSSLDVNNNSPTKLTGTLTVDGLTDVNNDTQSTSPTNGALHVKGGTGIERNLNVGGDAKFDQTLSVVTAGTPGNEFGGHVASFENTLNGNGIQIKVGANTPHNNNNFITFLNSSGTTVGRIEGEDGAADLANNQEYQDEIHFFNVDRGLAITGVTIATAETVVAAADVAISTADVAIAIAETAMAAADVAAAASSSTACAGVGACVTTPVPSLIAAAGANLVVTIANGVVTAGNLVLATANVGLAATNLGLATADVILVEQARDRFINTHEDLKGITFASGAGDYAEYLPKLNSGVDFMPGEVVGLKNGFISRNTLGADRIMVISFKPAVLGALPEEGTEGAYEKVAFLGQIPTKVIGEVKLGDYILPSGFHNGCAIAKSPDKMLLSDYKKILGVAWEGAEDKGINYVNVAVGLNVNDLSGVIQKQQEELKSLKGQMAQTNSILADLVPGFKEAANSDMAFVELETGTIEAQHDAQHGASEPHGHEHDHEFLTQHDVEMVRPDETNIVYYVPEKKEYKEWIEMARNIYLEKGIDIDAHPFWNRLSTDPDYMEEVIIDLETKFKESIHFHAEANKSK